MRFRPPVVYILIALDPLCTYNPLDQPDDLDAGVTSTACTSPSLSPGPHANCNAGPPKSAVRETPIAIKEPPNGPFLASIRASLNLFHRASTVHSHTLTHPHPSHTPALGLSTDHLPSRALVTTLAGTLPLSRQAAFPTPTHAHAHAHAPANHLHTPTFSATLADRTAPHRTALRRTQTARLAFLSVRLQTSVPAASLYAFACLSKTTSSTRATATCYATLELHYHCHCHCHCTCTTTASRLPRLNHLRLPPSFPAPRLAASPRNRGLSTLLMCPPAPSPSSCLRSERLPVPSQHVALRQLAALPCRRAICETKDPVGIEDWIG